MDYQTWMTKAINNIASTPNHTQFLIKDLFEGVEWTTLSKGERISFGRYFKNEVESGHVSGVKYERKASNNSAIYRKEI